MPVDAPDHARSRLAFTLLGVFAATVVFHAVMLPMVETGGDAVEGWFFVKKLSWGYDITEREWNHRTVRFGILGPAYAAVTLLGTRPWVYYVAPLLSSGIAAALLFHLTDRRLGRVAAWVAAAAFCLLPQIHLVAAQQKPSIFSIVYLLACANALAAFGDTKRHLHLVLAGVWLFFAYWTKVPNLFFVPGLAAVLLAEGGRAKQALVFGGTALVLIAAENGAHVWAGQEYGRLGYMLHKHFTSAALEPTDVLGLFERYTQLRGAWAVLFGTYLIAVATSIVRREALGPFERALVVLSVGFFVCTTFAVKSLDPLVPAQPMRDRYLTVAVPWMLLTVLVAARALLAKHTVPAARWLLPTAIGVAALGRLATHRVPMREHPLRILPAYEATFRDAFEDGRPVFASESRKPLRVARNLLWDPALNHDGKALPIIRWVKGEPQYWHLVDETRWQAERPRSRRRAVRGWRGESHLEAYRIIEEEDGKFITDLFRLRTAPIPR
ncbi:MAG: glycosyltransferase family 39 protein [Nannocystaceae bacterium]|nr:glycosyltransferase family 39 protein [bacterium]